MLNYQRVDSDESGWGNQCQPLRLLEASTLLDISLGTGRRHQIRSHLAFIGHAVVCDSKPLGFFLIKKYQPYPTVPTYHWEMGWKRLKWAENWLFISIHLSISIHIYPSWFTSETLCSTCPNSGTVQMRPSGRMPHSAPRTVSWPPMARWSDGRCFDASPLLRIPIRFAGFRSCFRYGFVWKWCISYSNGLSPCSPLKLLFVGIPYFQTNPYLQM